MKHLKSFDIFLKEHVNLSDARITQLDSRVTAVTNFLSAGTDVISLNFLELIPQGSYAQQTIINPVDTNDEFDADVLLDMNEVDGWDAADYVQELYTVLRSSGTYRDMVSRSARCVVIDYANEFHIDVVPFLTRHGSRYITNRRNNQFELTDPEGFNSWLEEQNRLSGGRLVKVIRLFKYLRDYKNNFSIKSVILTILLGGRVNDGALLVDPDCYKDVPTTLKSLAVGLNEYLQVNELMPSIDDPSCPTENFNHRWNQEEYSNFRSWFDTYCAQIVDAFDEQDDEVSRKKWRKIFGDEFGVSTSGSISKAADMHLARSNVTNTDELIETKLGVPMILDRRYKVSIGARVAHKTKFRDYELATRGNFVEKGRKIRFSIKKNTVPTPYDLYWKVRNTGEEAMTSNAIRGQILRDDGSFSRTEDTLYRGRHYVECYVVKDGVCVASDHHPVFIT